MHTYSTYVGMHPQRAWGSGPRAVLSSPVLDAAPSRPGRFPARVRATGARPGIKWLCLVRSRHVVIVARGIYGCSDIERLETAAGVQAPGRGDEFRGTPARG